MITAEARLGATWHGSAGGGQGAARRGTEPPEDTPGAPSCPDAAPERLEAGTLGPNDDRFSLPRERCLPCPVSAQSIAAALGEQADEVKRQFSTQRREDLAKQGEALPDGSYPIANEADLKNAIQAVGRAKDPEAAKAHIKKRAAALGAENLIPEGWKDGEPETIEWKSDGRHETKVMPITGLKVLNEERGHHRGVRLGHRHPRPGQRHHRAGCLREDPGPARCPRACGPTTGPPR